MKLFSELGSCFYGGGATVTPGSAAETCCRSSVQQDDEKRDVNLNRSGSGGSGGSSNEAVAMADRLRKMRSANTSRNWKPKLHVISEDSVVMMANHDRSRSSSAVRSADKLSVKGKASKSKPKAPSYTYGDGYWTSASMWAIPAFSPTPF